MLADQPIVLVTDPDFAHGRLQDDGITVSLIWNRVIVPVIFQMVIVRNIAEPIVAHIETTIGQRAYLGFVVRLEGILTILADVSFARETPLVDLIYDPPDIFVNRLQTGKHLLLQRFNQMRFQELDVVFNRGLFILIFN